MLRLLGKSLKEFGLNGQVATITNTEEESSLLNIGWDDHRVELHYKQRALELLARPEDMKAVIDHEVCHIVTIPTLKMIGTGNRLLDPALLEYMDLIREFLAEREFVRRWPHRRGYLQFKKRCFDAERAFSDHAYYTQELGNPVYAFWVCLCRVFYDSIYFHLVGDRTFIRWCEQEGRTAYATLFRYAMEDMACIVQQPLEYMQKLQLVVDSFKAFICVDVETLQEENRLAWLHDVAAMPIDPLLKDLWQSRGLEMTRL
jgi:hypothetical protein